MLIGLTGLAGAGKDFCAHYLIGSYGFERIAFADKLKEFAYDINPDLRQAVDALGWDAAKKIPKNREFLQDVGHEGRKHFGDSFWIDQALPLDDSLNGKNIVVTDMRYENEFERVTSLGGIKVRITRPGLKPVNNHPTELEHLEYPVDFSILNSTAVDTFLHLDDILNHYDFLEGYNV